jgi:hypothetical protein
LIFSDWLADEIKNEIGNKETDVPDFLIILGQNAN